MHVVLSTDAIIHIFAVMIEFLDAAVTSFAVIAVFVHVNAAAAAPDE